MKTGFKFVTLLNNRSHKRLKARENEKPTPRTSIGPFLENKSLVTGSARSLCSGCQIVVLEYESVIVAGLHVMDVVQRKEDEAGLHAL